MAISEQEMQKLRASFEADLDAYMTEWKESLATAFGVKRQKSLAVPPIKLADHEKPEPGELLDIPDIRQQDDYACGAACAASVGRYFGVGPKSLEEWKKILHTSVKESTAEPRIVAYLRELGLSVEERHGMTIDDLQQCWQEGKPVICPIQEYGIPSKQASFAYGHYVVVIGVGVPEGYLVVQDPSVDNIASGDDSDEAPGRMLIEESKWLEVWHDKDAEGNEYRRYGIIVGQSQESP